MNYTSVLAKNLGSDFFKVAYIMDYRYASFSRHIGTALLLFLILLQSACSDDEPIKVGFLGGVSGRVADLGIGGRNGAMLAFEIRNASGGIFGRPLQLIVEDDKQDENQAKAGLNRLIANKVEAVIGPMTSSMAVVVTPLANEARMLLLSPTVTTTALSGIEDYFMRVLSPTSLYAAKSARYHYLNQGTRRTAVIYDLNNRAYTESWLSDYREVFESLGGQIEPVIPFKSTNRVQFANLVDQVVTSAPDSVLILANSVDSASIAQQLRKKNASIRFNASEWAATERLIELGGKAVEGSVMAQFVDRNSTNPGYRSFQKAYLDRFGHEPGFAGLTGYDAANVIIDALASRQPGQDIRDAILQKSRYSGAQSELVFDASGDTRRDTFLVTIKDGQYVRL